MRRPVLLAALAGGVLGALAALALRPSGPPPMRESGRASSRTASSDGLGPATARAGAELFDAIAPGPIPGRTRAAECAAWLLADARCARALAANLPLPYAAAVPPGETFAAPPATIELDAARDETARATAAADAAALRDALVAEHAAERAWLAGAARDVPAAVLGAAWRASRLERASELETIAGERLASETPLQSEIAHAIAPEFALTLFAADDAPYAGLPAIRVASLVTAAAPSPAPASPGGTAGALALLLLAGATLGAVAAGATTALAVALRRRPGGLPALDFPRRDPSEAGPWLHVVAGPSSRAVARAVLEVAAHPLARGERVLVVDAGWRLRLHARFDREPRWGLMECLNADMPMLGLVQYAGRPGLYLLAFGNPARGGDGWIRFGRRLDEARPHFSRIVVAVDSRAPRALGEALMGRPLEGWWGDGADRLPNAGVEMSARLGIAFSCMDLGAIPEPSLEALSSRVRRLEPGLSSRPSTRLTEPPVVRATLPPLLPPPPLVLDYDLQVRERLRFLAWMRRVQKESRRRAEAGAVPQT